PPRGRPRRGGGPAPRARGARRGRGGRRRRSRRSPRAPRARGSRRARSRRGRPGRGRRWSGDGAWCAPAGGPRRGAIGPRRRARFKPRRRMVLGDGAALGYPSRMRALLSVLLLTLAGCAVERYSIAALPRTAIPLSSEVQARFDYAHVGSVALTQRWDDDEVTIHEGKLH